jgi:hypothetical protein
MKTYYCPRCGRYHRIDSQIGIKHNPYGISAFKKFIEKYKKKKAIEEELYYLSQMYGLTKQQQEKIRKILEVFYNPPYISNPGVKALVMQLYQKLLEVSKRGAPLAKKTAKRIGEAVKLGTKELIKAFKMIREHRLSHKQLRELAAAIDVLWRSGLIDLDLSEDERKRRREIALLVKYGLLDPDILKEIISKKVYKL